MSKLLEQLAKKYGPDLNRSPELGRDKTGSTN